MRIFLEGNDRDLDRVTRVVYHLHPTFYQRDRTVTDRTANFELNTSAWGMFNLTADVHMTGQQKPLKLGRYLNF
ncbi:pYEATS domain-containing protein [Streptomyces sp. NPDC060035]|uniref:pYEATS domain-containing protein n=1 Tax=Streptomyces sp. NPDC060035 TaxID=3347044 RepID=UPI0036A8C7F8